MRQIATFSLLSLLCMQSLTALTTNWTNSGVGNWNTPGNWDNGVPTASDTANIGIGGTAQLNVLPDGNAFQLSLGVAPNSGSLLVDNRSLSLTNFSVGVAGAGHAIIQNGGTVTSNVSVMGQGGPGTVVVDGAGSTWTTNTNDIGLIQPATMTIQNGGRVNANISVISLNVPASSSSVTVTNPGSLWNIATLLQVGANASGSMTISDGGEVRSGPASIIAPLSTVTATGTGSLWTVTGTLTVALNGNSSLTVQDGAQVSTTDTTSVFGPNATVNLNGTTGRRGVLTVPQLLTGVLTSQANFDGGILQANTNNAVFISGFAPGKLNILAGGLFIDSQTFNIGTNNGFSGVGPLTKTGIGILTLSGTNTYGGSTTVSGGTLKINATASLPTNTDVTLSTSGATLDLITAAGSFTIGDLSGVAGSAITLGTSNLTFGTANSTTFDGSISGSGDLTKQGSGTVTFSGTSTYTGPTSINAGTFVLNGSITSSTTVAAGATLKGIGTLSSSLNVFGTVRPGNSVGTLNVLGPVTFNTGSTFVAEVSPAQASLLNVTGGNVTINSGVTLSILVDPGTYALGSVYTIIQTTGGVIGQFSPVIDNSPLLEFTVLYPTNLVQLLLNKKANAFTGLVSNGNAGAVAACLDRSNPAPGTDFNFVVSQLLFVPNAKVLKHALNQMQPSQYNALHLTQENTNT